MGIITLDINAKPNRPPSQSGWLAIALGYGINHTFTVANFTTETTPSYSDPEGDPLKEIKVTSLPTQGILKLAGTPIIVNDVITSAQLGGSLFTYESDSGDTDGYTDSYMRFTVSDTGSSTFTTSPKIVTFTVEGNVNEPPSQVGDGELDIVVGSTTVFTRAMLTVGLNPMYQDPEGDIALNLLVEVVPVFGNLFLSGVLVVDGQIIPFTEIDASNLTYVNDSVEVGDATEGFTFKIADAGSGEYVG
jgi:hypothetical protein